MRGELGGSLEHHRGGGRGAAQVYARVYPRVFLKVFLEFTLEFSLEFSLRVYPKVFPRVYPRTSQSIRTWGCSRLHFPFCNTVLCATHSAEQRGKKLESRNPSTSLVNVLHTLCVASAFELSTLHTTLWYCVSVPNSTAVVNQDMG